MSRALAGPGDPRHWHQITRHIFHALDGDPDTLLSDGPALEQLRWADAGWLVSRTDVAA